MADQQVNRFGGGAFPQKIKDMADGSWSEVIATKQLDASGNVIDTTLPAQVVGSVAAGSADSGNPVKVGGIYNTTPPALVAGQRGDVQLDSVSNLRARLVATFATGVDGISNTSLVGTLGAWNSQTSGIYLGVVPFTFNGASWDRKVKANATSRIASAAATTNPTSAKGSAGNVFKISGNNVKASVIYLKLYNKATAPTVGTDTPLKTIAIPASAVFNLDIGGADGFYFGTGIGYGFTTDATDAGTTALAAGDILDFCLDFS